MWKKRFPIQRHIRFHYAIGVEAVYSIAVLHNLSILWKQPLPDDEEEDYIRPEYRNVNQGQVHVFNDLDQAAVRAEGEVIRISLVENMPPATARDL